MSSSSNWYIPAEEEEEMHPPPLPPRMPVSRKLTMPFSQSRDLFRKVSAPSQGTEISDIDIAIIHASDMKEWALYIKDTFKSLQQAHKVRVVSRSIEDLYNTSAIEIKQIYDAKLQIVIVSPAFLKNILAHTNKPLGEKLQPDRVLALMMDVSDHDVTELHSSVLFSYNEWCKLVVHEGEMTIIEEMMSLGIKIMSNCNLYKGYQDQESAHFKITPTKVKQVHQVNVYIILQKPIKSLEEVHINLVVKGRESVQLDQKDLKKRNPYTISFKVPDFLLNGLSILSVEVMIDKNSLGCRYLKCESKMDTLYDILTSVSNPTDFMCQALNINAVPNELERKLELDRKLAESVKTSLPMQQFTKILEPIQDVSENIMLPTWVHFSAYYGLEQLTHALLKVPGAASVLRLPNGINLSPAELAYKKGFTKLSRELEEFAELSLVELPTGRMYHSGGSAETLVMEVPYMEPPLPRPIACSPSPTSELEATSTNSLSSNMLCSSNLPCNPASCQSLVGQYDTLPDPKPLPAFQEMFCNGETATPEKEYLNMSGSKDNSFQDGTSNNRYTSDSAEETQPASVEAPMQRKVAQAFFNMLTSGIRRLPTTTSLESSVSRNPSDNNPYIKDPTDPGQSKSSIKKSNSFDSQESIWVGSETRQYQRGHSLKKQGSLEANQNQVRDAFTVQQPAEQLTQVGKEINTKHQGQIFPIAFSTYLGNSGTSKSNISNNSNEMQNYLKPEDINPPVKEEMPNSHIAFRGPERKRTIPLFRPNN